MPAEVETRSITAIKLDDFVEIRPEERAIRKYATSDNGIAAILPLANEPIGNRLRLILDMNTIRR